MRSETTRHRQRQALPQTNEICRRGAFTCRTVTVWSRRDRVPVQGAVDGTPLPLEAICARVASRAAEVEAAVTLDTRRSNRFPVEQHVRAQGEVLGETRRPRNRHHV